MNKWMLSVIGTDVIILILVNALAEFNTIPSLIGANLILLITMTTILVFGMPAIDIPMNRKLISGFVLFIPYLILLLTGLSGISQFILFVVWYVLPTALFTLASKYQGVISTSLNLVAAAFLWIGFDHRYTTSLFENIGEAYLFNSLWMAAVGLASYSGGIFTKHAFDRGIVPTKQGSVIANVVTPLASIIIVPFGLVTGFLSWNPQIDVVEILIQLIGIYLTISLQEEFIFRAVGLKELDTITNNQSTLSLIVISALFALTHWNNEIAEYVPHYFFAAFVAGLAYGVAYRKGGMFASMLSHTLVDLVWATFLQRI